MDDLRYELVSVVIPSQNRRTMLERAIESVRKQTWRNIEIIVIDDASSDDTPAYLRDLAASDSGVRVVRNEHPEGGASARNRGIELAQGTYIAFLDDDDIWLPKKLERQIALLQENPVAAAVSCSFFIEHASGRRTRKRIFEAAEDQQLLRTNHLGGASMCLTTRELLNVIGGFEPSLRSGQDWDLWLRLADHGPVLVCPEPLVCYRPHEGARITTNLRATYSGRRNIYLRYKRRMTKATRLWHLGELLYCRKVQLRLAQHHRIVGLLRVVQLVGIRRGLRFCYRYIRHSIPARMRMPV